MASKNLNLLFPILLITTLRTLVWGSKYEYVNSQCTGKMNFFECELTGPIDEYNNMWKICDYDKDINSLSFIGNGHKLNQDTIPMKLFTACEKLSTLKLVKMNVKLNNLQLPQNVHTLELFNQEYDFNANFSNFSNLKRLNLNELIVGNAMTKLLNYVPELTELNIFAVQFKFVDGLLKKLKYLKSLGLQRIDLEKITNVTFVGNNLEKLNLWGNKIILDDHVFANLPSLMELFLGGNQIKAINSEIFYGLKRLRKLFLDSNQITHLPDFVFEHLESLEYLHISYNKLKEVNGIAFYGLKKLKYASFLQNNILSVDKEFFVNLINLEYLHLANNRLEIFHNYSDTEYFQRLSTLDELNFGFFGLSKIYLNGNPLKCVCENEWLGTILPDLMCFLDNKGVFISEWSLEKNCSENIIPENLNKMLPTLSSSAENFNPFYFIPIFMVFILNKII